MLSQLGPFLRHLRQSNSLSQVHVAQQAGIGRVTLNRWENGKQFPRTIELEAVLQVLQATHEQTQQAVHLLGTAEGRSQERASAERVGEQKGLGPRPHAGSLLMALRLRARLSQEEAAQKAGVTTRTLRRWEKAEAWPSTSQLHTLCYVLGTRPQELMALTTGGPQLEMGGNSEAPSLEELYERCQVLHHYAEDSQVESLKELGFIALESQAWSVATQSAAGRQMLSRIYSCHANYYSSYERWKEGELYAMRALDLASDTHPDRGTIQAAIAAARCATYRSGNPAPSRGLGLLQRWLELTIWPDFRCWILSDMAKYEALRGNTARSLELARLAREVARSSDTIYDFYLRELDEAQILLQAGEANQTLHIVERERTYLQPEHTVQFRLLEAEAALSLRDANRANDCVREAQHIIDDKALLHLQPRVQRVVEQF